MKIGGSLRAVWITIFALGLRCESQGGPGLVVIHYNGYELPSKSSWAGLCSPWASVGNRLFCGPLTKFGPKAISDGCRWYMVVTFLGVGGRGKAWLIVGSLWNPYLSFPS